MVAGECTVAQLYLTQNVAVHTCNCVLPSNIAVCGMQLLVSIDGFTQELELSADVDAQHVYRLPDERITVCTRTSVDKSTTQNATKLQKHYYYLITLPGYGVVQCAVLKSGCRCLPEELAEGFHFWFDLLATLKLATEAEQEYFQKKQWKVCNYTHVLSSPCSHSDIALSRVAFQLSSHCSVSPLPDAILSL